MGLMVFGVMGFTVWVVILDSLYYIYEKKVKFAISYFENPF